MRQTTTGTFRNRRSTPVPPTLALLVLALLGVGSVSGAITNLQVVGPAGVVGRLSQQSPAGPTWLETLNAYRTSVGLAALANDPSLQRGVDLHARYLARSGSTLHNEDPANPLYTEAGARSASQSLVGGWSARTRTDRELIEDWVIAPFHSAHMFEPRLQRVGFGVVRNEPGAALDVAAVLNIVGGIGRKTTIGQPVVFPGRGSTVPLTSFRVETPNPLTHCAGFVAPAGLPLLVMFPSAPDAVTATLSTGGSAVETCVIDASYRNPDTSAQQVGRTLLTQKRMVIVIPRLPLLVGSAYEASVTGGRAGPVQWSFTIGPEGSALPLPAAAAIGIGAVGLNRNPTTTRKSAGGKT